MTGEGEDMNNLEKSDERMSDVNKMNEDLDPTDPNSVYFLATTDTLTSGANKELLVGSNWITWKREMMLTLTFKNKLGFIDGSIPMPDLDSKLFRPWMRCNNIVLSWLLKSLSEDIKATVMFCEIASDLWQKISLRHSQVDNIKIYNMQLQILSKSQGDLSVQQYYTFLCGLWESLRAHRPVPKCTCVNGIKTTECIACNMETDRMFQFLMGLNSEYDSIRGQICMQRPVPDLDTAFNIVLCEESQKAARQASNQAGDSATYAVNNANPKRKGRDHCENCGKAGHTIDKCYRIIGFPQNFKFTKKPTYPKGTGSAPNHQAAQSSAHFTQLNGPVGYHGYGQAAQGFAYPQQVTGYQYAQMKTQVQNLLHMMDQHSHTQPSSSGTSFSADTVMAPVDHQSQNRMAGSFFKDKDWSR